MKCARCGKEQPDRSIHCPYCGHRLHREAREVKEPVAVDGARPLLIEFPTTLHRNIQRGADKTRIAVGANWRAELSERVRQVKERRNLQEARGRLQAELEAAAQRYHQASAQPASLQQGISPAEQPTEGPPEREERHPNPIIDAALRRARRASEVAGQGQQATANLATATAPKILPQVQTTTKPKPTVSTLPLAKEQPLAATEPVAAAEVEPSPIEKPSPAATPPTPTTISEPAPPARPALEAHPRLLDLDHLELPNKEKERPMRVIKESESSPNYLDELIAICEQNLSNEHARYSQRVVAAIIDLFFIALFSAPYWAVSYAAGINLADQRVLMLLGAATLVVALVYLTLTTRASARTLGMIFVGTRVINSNTGAPPSLLQALLRSFGYFFSTAIAGLGFAWMFLDRERRGLHDLISGTSVVRDY